MFLPKERSSDYETPEKLCVWMTQIITCTQLSILYTLPEELLPFVISSSQCARVVNPCTVNYEKLLLKLQLQCKFKDDYVAICITMRLIHVNFESVMHKGLSGLGRWMAGALKLNTFFVKKIPTCLNVIEIKILTRYLNHCFCKWRTFSSLTI